MAAPGPLPASLECRSCGASLPEESRFCSRCGAKIGKRELSPRSVILVSVAALLLWGGASGITVLVQRADNRVKPTTPFVETEEGKQAALDSGGSVAESAPGAGGKVEESKEDAEALAPLREAAVASPTDVEALNALGLALVERSRGRGASGLGWALEAVDVFSRALQVDPSNQRALLNLAELSFEQRVFEKSRDYYARYLQLDPANESIRARYASSLTFTGEVDKAISELKGILDKSPSNFHANAYLSIAYAQTGKKEDALALGRKTLELAPNEEAKRRFQQFLTALEASEGVEGSPPPTSSSEAARSGSIEEFTEAVRGNPVAGSKFDRYQVTDDGAVRLYFHDFPMGAMPPFAKEKFFASLLGRVPSGTKLIVFIDSTTQREMERLTVPEEKR